MSEATGSSEIAAPPAEADAASDDGKSGRLERIAPAIAAIVIALPTLLAYYPPMSDLPMHEGVVGALRHFRDPAYFPDDLYVLNLGHPNQLFHLTSWAFSLLFGTRWAVKIVIALSQLAIFHAGSKLADYLGRVRWGVMLLAPLALGFTYYWGLVANLLGFSILLYSLPVFDRMVAAPTRRTLAQACGALLLLFFAHESAFLMATGVIALFTIARPLELRTTALRLTPVVFATTLGLSNFIYQLIGVAKSKTIFTTVNVGATWFTIPEKLAMFSNALFGSYDATERALLLGLGLLGAVTLLVARVRYDDVASEVPPDSLRVRQLAFRFRFELIAVAFLLLYFTMPFNYKGITLLHERFLGPAWAVFVVVVAPKKRTPRLAPLAVSVLPLAILLVSWPQFDNASRTYRSLDAMVEHIPLGKTVTFCILERRGANTVRVFSAGPGPARTLATRGGRSSLGLIGSPISPVRMRPEYVWDEYDVRTYLYGSRSLSPGYDLQRWEYVLAQSRDPDIRAAIRAVLSPEASIVAADGEWMLFHSNLPQVSPASGSTIPPQAALDDTLMHRMFRLGQRDLDMQGGR